MTFNGGFTMHTIDIRELVHRKSKRLNHILVSYTYGKNSTISLTYMICKIRISSSFANVDQTGADSDTFEILLTHHVRLVHVRLITRFERSRQGDNILTARLQVYNTEGHNTDLKTKLFLTAINTERKRRKKNKAEGKKYNVSVKKPKPNCSIETRATLYCN